MSRQRFVYFIEAETAANVRAVKIGVAGNPNARARDLQCGSPTRLHLLAYVPGDEALERKLHATFEPVALRGEWFARKGKLDFFLNYIEGFAHDAGMSGLVPFEMFEVAIGDNIACDSWMPVCGESEEEHETSAKRELWVEYA